MFEAASCNELISAFGEPDHLRRRIASELENRLRALMKKHDIEVDEKYTLLNSPTPETLVAFFNECVREAGTLAFSDILTRK